jgi:hypothetical protein
MTDVVGNVQAGRGRRKRQLMVEHFGHTKTEAPYLTKIDDPNLLSTEK